MFESPSMKNHAHCELDPFRSSTFAAGARNYISRTIRSSLSEKVSLETLTDTRRSSSYITPVACSRKRGPQSADIKGMVGSATPSYHCMRCCLVSIQNQVMMYRHPKQMVLSNIWQIHCLGMTSLIYVTRRKSLFAFNKTNTKSPRLFQNLFSDRNKTVPRVSAAR